MLTPAERERVYGGPEGVAAADRYIAESVAAAPPLTRAQKDRLRALWRPAPSERPQESSPRRQHGPRNANAA